MRVYGHLQGYLHRWRIMGLGRFMVRHHHILDIDRTPFLHTHPFHYISFVLRGGYTEQYLNDGELVTVRHKRWSLIVRRNTIAHRISAIEPNTRTLFFTWRTNGQEQGWELVRHPDVETPHGCVKVPDGLYAFENGWRRRAGGVWYVLRDTPERAAECVRYSIHQNLEGGTVVV
jgi:hypothetical protein